MGSVKLAITFTIFSWIFLLPVKCQNKELAVIGLFQVRETLNGECDESKTNIPSVMSLQAVKWSFQKLYESSDIPSIKLIPYETCGISEIAAEETMRILTDSNKTTLLTMVDLMVTLEWNRIAILHDNDLYGLEIVQYLTTLATSKGICIPSTYEITTNTGQNQGVLDDLLLTANPPLKGIVFVGRRDVGHLFMKLMETSAYTNTPALILCETMQLQLDAFSDASGKMFDKSKGSYVLSPEYVEVEEFKTYWIDMFMNQSKLIDQSEGNPWLSDIYQENFGCRPSESVTCPPLSESDVNELFADQPVYVGYAVKAAFTYAATVKKAVRNYCQSAVPCQIFFEQFGANELLKLIADTNVTFGDDFGFLPKNLRGERISMKNPSSSENYLYSVYNLQSNDGQSDDGEFQFAKIAEYDGTTLTLLNTTIKDYEYDSSSKSAQEYIWPNIRRAQCPAKDVCTECLTGTVEDEFIFVEGDLYVLAMVPYRKSDAELGCGGPAESNLNGFGNAIAIQKALRDSNTLNQFGTQRIGLVLFDSCSNPTQSDWRIKDTLKSGVKLQNGSSVDIRDKILGTIASYFSSISVAISRTLTSLKILHMAYGATSPTLSNRETYPFFMRVATPDNKQADATVRILKQMKINYIQLIYSDDAYGIGFKDAFSTAAEAEQICIDNKLALDAESSTQINRIFPLLRTKPHARLVVVFTSTFVLELLKSLTARMETGEFLFLGSESWGINDDALKLPNSNRLIGSITINLELKDTFGMESSMKNIDIGYTEGNKNPWTETYLQNTMRCHYNTSFDKSYSDTCDESFANFWDDNNLKVSNWGNFAYLATQALLNSSSGIFMNKCGDRPTVCEEYKENIDELINHLKDNSKVNINGQETAVFDRNGDGNIGYVIYNIQNTGGVLHYTEIGRYSADNSFTLDESLVVGPVGSTFESVCPNERACAECLPREEPTPKTESSCSHNSAIALGSLFGIVLIALLVSLVIVFLLHRRIRKIQQKGALFFLYV